MNVSKCHTASTFKLKPPPTAKSISFPQKICHVHVDLRNRVTAEYYCLKLTVKR